jgi:hypothetical protein
MMSEPKAIPEWKPREGRNYVDVLDSLTVRINGMQIDHLGSGLYIDRRTMKKYDYEEDAKEYGTITKYDSTPTAVDYPPENEEPSISSHSK